MQKAYKNLRDCIMYNPLGLSVLPKNMINDAYRYFPYSVGIEIECSPIVYSTEDPERELKFRRFKISTTHKYMMIDGIMSVEITTCEQRFRLSPGIRGMIALYKICENLKDDFYFNEESGIHYHIDCSDDFNRITTFLVTEKSERLRNALLNELDNWGYTGRYNSRNFGGRFGKDVWVNLSVHKTLEFRVGEMSFDYNLIIKRILHCQSIVKRVKNNTINFYANRY
jgi:hypothetical protein